MKILFYIFFIFCSFSQLIISQSIKRVPSQFPKIQEAINQAANGDTIIVEPGTYFENLNLLGKKIILASQYLENFNILNIARTIIDGGNLSSVIECSSGEDSTTYIVGFTIQNGHAHLINNSNGGGIKVLNSGLSIFNCIIKNNKAESSGGGFYGNNISSLTIKDCDFSGNTAVLNGGGIAIDTGQCSINNSRIQNNLAFSGGGIYIYMAPALILNCIINNNVALSSGGGICASQKSDYTLQSSTLFTNQAALGGAICNRTSLTPVFINVTLAYNNAIEKGGAVYNSGLKSKNTIINSILYYNVSSSANQIYCSDSSSLALAYNDIESGIDEIVAISNSNINNYGKNINFPPSFENAGIKDFSLSENSFCLGGGVKSIIIDGKVYESPEKDMFKTERPTPVFSNPDLGAIESPLPYHKISIKIDTVFGISYDTVTVPVRVNNFKEITDFTVTIQYDTTKLSLNRISNFLIGLNSPIVESLNGAVKITFSGLNNVSFTENKIFDLKFNLKDIFLPANISLKDCSLTDVDGYKPEINLYNGAVILGSVLSGSITYYNSFNAPVNNVLVTMTRMSNGTTLSTTTNSNGNYSFAGLAPEKYLIKAERAGDIGGINATDALLTVKYYVGMNAFDKLQRCAADVNNNSIVNASDALIILNKYINPDLVYFNNKPDWVFKESVGAALYKDDFQQFDTVLIRFPVMSLNIKALCSGDVNKSYSFANVSKDMFNLQSTIIVSDKEEIKIPVTAGSSFEPGSITLEIKYPNDVLAFTGICKSEKFKDLIYKDNNGIVKIGWIDYENNGKPRFIEKNEDILTLSFKPLKAKVNNEVQLYYDFEIANNNGDILNSTNLIKVENNRALPANFSLSQNYPNPFNPETVVKYSIPSESKVELKVFNLLGEQISVLVNEVKEAGLYQVKFNGKGIASGIYFYELSAKPVNGLPSYHSYKKMILLK